MLPSDCEGKLPQQGKNVAVHRHDKSQCTIFLNIMVMGFMDRLGMAMEMTSKRLQQNAYYCGYDYDTMVNNILVFSPDGKVIFCAINFPGSWLDGKLTACFFLNIKGRIDDYKIGVDQGFPQRQSGDGTRILVGPIPKRNAHQLYSLVRGNLICLSNVYMPPQLAEWRMHRLQWAFPRCFLDQLK